MGRITIDLAPEWLRRSGDKVKKAAILGMRTAAARSVTHIQTVIIPNTRLASGRLAPPIDTRGYTAGWRAKPLDKGAIITHVNQKLAAIVEHGINAKNVKIGRAMLTALASWALRKRIATTTAEAAQVAWAIAKTFEKKGMEGRKVLERAQPDIRQFVRREVARNISEALKR